MYGAHQSLEWLRPKRTSFPLPGSFLAQAHCSWPSLWKRSFLSNIEGLMIGRHSISIHVTTSNNSRASVWQSTDWLHKAQIQGLHRTIRELSQFELWASYSFMWFCIPELGIPHSTVVYHPVPRWLKKYMWHKFCPHTWPRKTFKFKGDTTTSYKCTFVLSSETLRIDQHVMTGFYILPVEFNNFY